MVAATDSGVELETSVTMGPFPPPTRLSRVSLLRGLPILQQDTSQRLCTNEAGYREEGGTPGCQTSRPSTLKHIKGPQRVSGTGASCRQEMQQNPGSETPTSISQVLLDLCPADQALGEGTHLCPTQPWWFEAVRAGRGPRARQPHLGTQCRWSGLSFSARSRPGAWAVHGGGAGEAMPVRRAHGDLTELACDGPLLARRTVPSPDENCTPTVPREFSVYLSRISSSVAGNLGASPGRAQLNVLCKRTCQYKSLYQERFVVQTF